MQYYYQGVYSSSRCSSSDINHAMVVTGYGSTGGSDFWLVKNRYTTTYTTSVHNVESVAVSPHVIL